MKPSQWTLRWVTLCGCGMLAASAAAVELPGTVQPSQLDERFKPRSEPQAKPEAPLVVPKQVAPQGSEQIRFELREIRIEGNTRYDKAVLESYYQHMLGKQVSLAELVDLANRLTAKYRQDGYLLTQVVVPEQSIEGGKVRLQVIEGYLEHVQIKGTVDGPRVRVEELLAPLTEKRPLDADTLERGLLLVGDLPGVNVQSVLSPGQALGSSNLDVALQQQRYEGFVSLDNRGSHYTDPTTLAFGATEFSRLGFYEQIDVLGAISPFSDATRYIQLRGTLPLGGMFAGDTLQIMGSYSKVNPDIPDSVFPFDSVSKSTEGSISYNHPFIRSRSQNLSGGLALQWKDTETRLRDFASDASNPGRDHVRVFQQRLTYDWVDRWMGINLAEVRNNIGLDMWGATKKDDERRSREVADGRFVYLNGNIGRLQGLGGPWSVYGELQWQYSFDPLLPSERFGVGGSGIGRGFAPGNITGDRGFALKLEPRYGQAVGYSWLRSYQGPTLSTTGARPTTSTWTMTSSRSSARSVPGCASTSPTSCRSTRRLPARSSASQPTSAMGSARRGSCSTWWRASEPCRPPFRRLLTEPLSGSAEREVCAQFRVFFSNFRFLRFFISMPSIRVEAGRRGVFLL